MHSLLGRKHLPRAKLNNYSDPKYFSEIFEKNPQLL